MPSLDWIGKSAVKNHHKEVPFRLLNCRADLSIGDPNSGNLIVQGDNLEALKALLPYYAGQVKCIYIDPPYNTGNEGWIYNDAVNSPEMRDWLGKVVGGETEDLSRHDKWLCMMYPRLSLLKQMLRSDGVIFVSIDDNELVDLKLILDELFGPQNFITVITWQKRVSPANDAKHFSSDHEYLVIYAVDKSKWRPNRLARDEGQLGNYRNPDNDPRGPWNSATYTCNKTIEERPNLYYGITNPNTGEVIFPRRTAVWRYNEVTHNKNVEENLLWWGADGKSKMPRIKKFLTNMGDVVPRSVWPFSDVGHTQEARTEILRIIGENPFTTPKPVRLIQRILQLASGKDDLILDSFAGSGTTGHAVIKQNRVDGGNRHFILVELDTNIASNITAQRLKKVVQGYIYSDQKGNEKNEPGLGGGFRFCELGATLFDPTGKIRPEVSYQDLAQHIYFIETGNPLPNNNGSGYPLLGINNNHAVYLLYNGVLRDKSPQGGNVLTYDLLDSLPEHTGPKTIYGTGCGIEEQTLREMEILFKQIPYEVKAN